MYPTNQIILGGDSMFNSIDDIDLQIQRMESYKQKLKQLQGVLKPQRLIWDDIDFEVNPMSEELKLRLLLDPEYAEIYNELQIMVQNEILNLVKARIESTERGKDLLSKLLRTVRKLKNKIISDTNKEMELFTKFKEYSKNNPNVTYEEFIKANI